VDGSSDGDRMGIRVCQRLANADGVLHNSRRAEDEAVDLAKSEGRRSYLSNISNASKMNRDEKKSQAKKCTTPLTHEPYKGGGTLLVMVSTYSRCEQWVGAKGGPSPPEGLWHG
jgi:hypothetical protein